MHKKMARLMLIGMLILVTACGEGKDDEILTLDQYKKVVAEKATVEKEQRSLINKFIEGFSEDGKYSLLNSEINEHGVFISFKFFKDNKPYIGVAYGIIDINGKIKFIDYKINEEKKNEIINNVYITGKLQSTPPRDYTIVAGIIEKDNITKVKLIYDRRDIITGFNDVNRDFMYYNIGSEKLNKIQVYDKKSQPLEEVLVNETP